MFHKPRDGILRCILQSLDDRRFVGQKMKLVVDFVHLSSDINSRLDFRQASAAGSQYRAEAMFMGRTDAE